MVCKSSKIFLVSFAIFVAIFINSPAFAGTFYVRPDGNDLNSGLENTPSGAFRTIQKAANTLNPGGMPPFQDEPTILELHQAAIRYAEVSPNKITNWRRQAAVKALLPEVSIGYDKDVDRTIEAYNYGGKTTYTIGPDDTGYGWDLSLKWDLGDLIYNDDQTSIDSRSKLMVQLRNDILSQLNTAYFERKRLQTDLSKIQDKTSPAYIERQLKIEELTAQIDALTGGYLSRRVGR